MVLSPPVFLLHRCGCGRPGHKFSSSQFDKRNMNEKRELDLRRAVAACIRKASIYPPIMTAPLNAPTSSFRVAY